MLPRRVAVVTHFLGVCGVWIIAAPDVCEQCANFHIAPVMSIPKIFAA